MIMTADALVKVLKVLSCLTPCYVSPTPPDSAPEYLSLMMLLSQKVLIAMVQAMQVLNAFRRFCGQCAYTIEQEARDVVLHYAALHIINAVLRLPQATYIMRLKPLDWSSSFKYCSNLIGGGITERCVVSLAIVAVMRFLGCDPTSISMTKCLQWHSPSKAEHLFLLDKEGWADGRSLELSVLSPFISSCAPPHIALAFASRIIAAACDLHAPEPSADDASALRLTAIISLFVGYASMVHLRTPIDWFQHAKGVMTYWSTKHGVDSDGVLAALKVMARCRSCCLAVLVALMHHSCVELLQAMKDTCAQAHKDGSYTLMDLWTQFLNLLQQLQVTVAYALQLQGEAAADIEALNDAAAPVMAWACDASSLACAPAVAACFSAFASFSRQQCLDTDIINLLASLKRFGEGVGGGDLMPLCMEIAGKLTGGGDETVEAVFPSAAIETVDEVFPSAAALVHVQVDNGTAAAADAHDYDAGGGLEDTTLNLDGEPMEAGVDDYSDGVGSPLAATPPPALQGASPLGGTGGEDAVPLPLTFSNAFVYAAPQHAQRPVSLLLQTQVTSASFPSYDTMDFGDVHEGSSVGRRAEFPEEVPRVDVDSFFMGVVSGLDSATEKLVKRAQERFKARKGGRTEEDAAPLLFENEEGDGYHSMHASAPPSQVHAAPSSFMYMSDAAADEALASNKVIAERLANIELMLAKLAAASDQIVPEKSSDSAQYNRHDQQEWQPRQQQHQQQQQQQPEDGISAMRSPLLTASSLQSNVADMMRDIQSLSDVAPAKPKAGRGGSNKSAAEAAAKYLHAASAADAAVAALVPAMPSFAAETTAAGHPDPSDVLPARKQIDSTPAAATPVQPHASSPSMDRLSLEKAMHALSGLTPRCVCIPAIDQHVSVRSKQQSGHDWSDGSCCWWLFEGKIWQSCVRGGI